MAGNLYSYYERELLFLRQFSRDFARQYPAAAGRLLLEDNRSVDPHVERMIESVALIASRVHQKLDDEFPEMTEAMLSVLYPHYLAPIPSLTLLQFDLDPSRAQAPTGFDIPKGSKLRTQSVGGLPCRFRTNYPVKLWPISVVDAQCMPPPFPAGFRPPPKTESALRIQLTCQGDMAFAGLSLDQLRFFLFGDNQLVANLYELIFNHTTHLVVRPLDPRSDQQPVLLDPRENLLPVGFEPDEGLLPYPNQSFLGYRLLTEFFCFPTKFQFVDVTGLERICREGFGRRVEFVFYLNRSIDSVEQAVAADTFRLGCTPVVNLFDHVAEPVVLDQSRHEYRVVPSAAHPLALEVYSIDSVTSIDATAKRTIEYRPFYSVEHDGGASEQEAYWYSSRRASPIEGDRGTDMFLNLVDLSFDPRIPSDAVLTLKLTCTNRELPSQMHLAGEKLHFELESPAPLSRIRTLRAPTPPLRPPTKRGAHWRLVSHLCLNHLSLCDPVEGRDALREILRLYDFSEPQAGQPMGALTAQLIDGISSVSTRRVVGQTGAETASGFCRGVEITVEFDDEKYVGSGLYLFASVLERFLGLYASINSFTQLVATTKQGEGYFKKWRPRAGNQQLT